MMSTVSAPVDRDSVEGALRSGLASGDAVTESIVPILRHVLASEDSSLFGDEIIARIRGMLHHLAGQLLDQYERVEGMEMAGEHNSGLVGVLSDAMIESAALLSHLHAVALEWQLTQRAEARFGIDPVLTPLLQGLIASNRAETAELGMRFLAAQARYGQAQRRMTLSLLELPGEILHVVLMVLQTASERIGRTAEQTEVAQSRVRQAYDEGSTRLGMASRLVSGLGGEARDALSIRHAGIAIFLSALSIGAGLDRDMAALSTHESQAARFALALRAAGLKGDAVLQQCLILHPDLPFAYGVEGIGADHAAAILAGGATHFGN